MLRPPLIYAVISFFIYVYIKKEWNVRRNVAKPTSSTMKIATVPLEEEKQFVIVAMHIIIPPTSSITYIYIYMLTEKIQNLYHFISYASEDGYIV
jgi:hypothetical protein